MIKAKKSQSMATDFHSWEGFALLQKFLEEKSLKGAKLKKGLSKYNGYKRKAKFSCNENFVGAEVFVFCSSSMILNNDTRIK